jgi:hypothetical protein
VTLKPANIPVDVRLTHVPLSNLVARGRKAEVPLSTLMPVTLDFKAGDTVTEALARAIWPLELAEVGK